MIDDDVFANNGDEITEGAQVILSDDDRAEVTEIEDSGGEVTVHVRYAPIHGAPYVSDHFPAERVPYEDIHRIVCRDIDSVVYPVKPWTMPEWMEEYRPLLLGGERAEELMNSEATTFENAPLALMAVEMKAKIGLLAKLHGLALLRPMAEQRGIGRVLIEGGSDR